MPFSPRTVGQLACCGFSLAAALPATAQIAPPADKVWTYVEQMPQLPGGGNNTAILAFIQHHVTYPPRAERARAEGQVFINFTVAATGKVENVAVVKGFRPDCDSAAVQGVLQLPQFEPGRQTGIPVPVRFTVPVTFRLQAEHLFSDEAPLNDSSRVYTFVQYMPLYKGKEGTKQLTEDLQYEFRTASATSGCALPEVALHVSLTVGPSGALYNVKAINNMAQSGIQIAAGPGTPESKPSQSLPAACEAALTAAASKLPRLKPGSLNGRRVAVSYTLLLRPPFK